MNDGERKLLMDLSLYRLELEQMATALALPIAHLPVWSREQLEMAERERNRRDVDLILTLVFRAGVTVEHAPVLSRLALADWHGSHENVIEALDRLRLPEAVDVFHRAALIRWPYREEDEFRTLAVKAIYALGKIATPAAVAALSEMAALTAEEEDEPLARNAREQLEWLAAGDSTSADTRAAARNALK